MPRGQSRGRVSTGIDLLADDRLDQVRPLRKLTRAVEDSLRRLQTDYIDLYQVHRPAPDTDIEETLSVLTDLLRQGKVRAIGASTFPAADIVEAQWVAERRGLARFRCEQPPSSILNRSIEREVLPACQRYGMAPSTSASRRCPAQQRCRRDITFRPQRSV